MHLDLRFHSKFQLCIANRFYNNLKSKAKIIFLGVLLSFSLTKIQAQDCVVNTGNPYVVCSGSNFILQGDLGGNYAAGNLSVWSQVSGPSVTILNASSNAAPNQPGIEHPATILGFVPGQTYTFMLTGYCANGINAQQNITFSTVGGITLANAGSDFTICNLSSGVLGGNTPLLTNEKGVWTGSGGGINVASGSSAKPLATVTSNAVTGGTANLTWTITNTVTGCISSDIAVVTNRGGQTPISAGSNITVSGCFSSTTSRVLSASAGGLTASGQFGTWSVISGPNSPSFSSTTSNTATVSNLIQGTYQLRWTVQGACVNGSADVFITVPTPTQSVTTAVNVAGSTTTFCDTRTSAVISGTVPTYSDEINVWTIVGGATIVNPSASTISITGLNTATSYTTRYYILNTLTGCASNTITGTINYATTAPVVTIPVSNTILGCGLTAVNLPYSVNISNVANTFSIISGPLITSSANAGASTVNLTGLTTSGTYIVRVQSKANGIGSCPVGYGDASVTTSVIPTNSNPGSQSSVACTATGGSLVGNVPTSGVGTWSQVSGPSSSTLFQFNTNTATVTGLINGAYVYRWLISGGPGCAASYQDVTIKVANTIPGSSFAGLDQAVCNLTPIFLNANTPRDFETGTWTVNPTIPGTNLAPNVNSPNLSVTGLSPNVDYFFRWTVSNSCNSGYSEAKVTVSTIAGPAQALAGPDICRIGAFTTATLAGNNPSPAGATGLWTQLSGPNTAVFSSTTISGPSLSGLTNGTYNFQWQLDRGGCNPSRDTVAVTIAVASVSGANAGSDVSLCGNATTLIGNNVSSVTGTWSIVNGNGGSSIASLNSFKTTVTGLSTGTYTFRWTLSNGVCPSTFDDVDVDVSSPPTTPNAGVDKTVCGASLVTLSGNTLSNGTGYWSVVGSAPGIATFSSSTSPTPTVSGLSGGTYNFRWTATGGPFCSSLTDDVVVNVSTNANAGVDQTLCNAPSVSLNGNMTGVWAQISGSTTSISTVSGTSINVSNLSFGGYDFQFTGFGKFGCPNTTDDVIVSISGYGTAPSAGIDQFLCNFTTTTLTGNLPASGIGSWSITSGSAGASIVGANLPNATIVGMKPGIVGSTLSGVYLLSWNVANGSCGTYQDEVRITTYATPTTANAGADQNNACSISTILSGSNAIIGVGNWTTVSGPSIASISFPQQSVTGVTNLTLGGYAFRWSISNGICPVSSDDVLVTVSGLSPDVADAGPFQGLCNATSTTLSGSNLINGTGVTWTKISGSAATLTSSITGITTLTGLTVGTYVYRYTTLYNACVSQSNVTITNSALPGNASITSTNFSVCPFVIPTVSGNNPSVGTKSWSYVSGPSSTPFFTNASSSVTGITGLTPGSYSFNYNVTNGFCPASTATTVFTILGNCPPTAVNLTFTGFEDQILSGTITGFSDPDGTIPTISGGTFTSSINGFPLTITSSISTTPGVGRVQFQPGTDYFGTDTYTYQVCDQGPLCATATITFVVQPVNDPPVVKNLTISGGSGTLLTNSLTLQQLYSTIPGSVYDVDNTSLTLNGSLILTSTGTLIGTTSNNQRVTISGTGSFSYLSSTTFSGVDTFTLRVSDGLATTTGTIFFNISVSSALPIPQNDTNSGNENTTIVGNVLGNDLNPLTGSSSGLTVTGVGTSTIGIISVSSITGSYTFIPTINIPGGVKSVTSITMNICNINGCVASTLTITVIGINDPPVVTNLSISGTSGALLTSSLTLFQNNSTIPGSIYDVDNTSLTLNGSLILTSTGTLIGTTSNNQRVTISGTGSVSYLSSTTFSGIDTFTLRVSDGLATTTGTIFFNISVSSALPIPQNDTNSGNENTTIVGNVLGNDLNPLTGSSSGLTVSGVGTSTIGIISISSITGSYTFIPTINIPGGVKSVTSINMNICNINGCAPSTLTITVIGINDPPVVTNLSISGTSGALLTSSLTLFQNNSTIPGSIYDVDNTSLTLNGSLILTSTGTLIGTTSNNQRVTISGTGSVSYLSSTTFSGIDTFTLRVSDGLATTTGTIFFNISVSSALPIPQNDTNSGNENTTIVGNVLGNDLNPLTGSSSGLTVSGVGTSTIGIISISSITGSYTFIPTINIPGGVKSVTSINMNICNINGCAPSTLTITVIGINDPPVVTNLSISGTSGALLTSSLTLFQNNSTIPGSIYDVDNTSLTLNGSLILTSTGTLIGTTSNNQRVTISGTGSVSYLSSTTFSGIDTFTLRVSDGLATTTGTIFFNISVSSALPIPQNDTNSGNENTTIVGNVLGNDLNPLTGSSSGLTVSGVGTSTIGIISISSITGSYTFIPTINIPGGVKSVTSINMNICNINGCAPSTLTITVIGINDPPTAIDLSFSGLEDTPIPTSITGWFDPDGDFLTVSITGFPTNGSVSGSGFNQVYNPNLNYNGIDTYTYLVRDPGGLTSSIRTVTISITGVNDPPVVTNLTLSGGAGTLLTSNLTLFQNNSAIPGSIYDVDNTSLTLNGSLILTSTGTLIGTTSNNQRVTISGTGIVSYLSSTTFSGIDTFTLRVSDGLATTTGTIFFNISVSSALPIPQNDTNSGNENTTIVGNVLGNDLNPLTGSSSGLTVTGVGTSTIGIISISSITGSYTFIPTINIPGGVKSVTSINMNICNVNGCVASTLTITVIGINDPPTAIDLSFSGLEDTAIPTSITGWFDIDGDPLTVSITGFPANGTLTGSGFDFTYFPNPNYNGIDSYTYLVYDTGNLTSNIATVTITVTGVNDPPVVTNLTLSGTSGTLLTSSLTLFQNDSSIAGSIYDVDNTSLTLNSSLVLTSTGTLIGTTTNNQSVTISGTGIVSYLSNTTFTGIDSFALNISDGLATATGTIFFKVSTSTALPDPQDDFNSGNENTTIVGNVLGNDLNPLTGSSSGLTVTGVGTSTIGTISIDPLTGSYTFIPTINLPGGVNSVTSINMNICNINGCVPSTLTITVIGINDPPVITNLSISGTSGVLLTSSLTLFQNNSAIPGSIYDVDNTSLTLNTTLVLTSTGTLIGITSNNQSVTISGTGIVSYLSSTTFSGIDTFTLRVSDGLATATGTIFFNISASSVLPIPQNDINSGNENTTIIGNVLGNDLNPLTGSSSGLTVTGVGTSPIGTISIDGSTGGYIFIPTINIPGGVKNVTSINMNICNINGCVASTLIITVIGINDPPTAINLTFSGFENTSIATSITGWFDPDGDPLTVSITGFPANGTISGTDFNQVYMPNLNFNGIDTYTYLVQDPGGLTSSIRTVTVLVLPVNHPPVAINLLVVTNENTPILNTITGFSDIETASADLIVSTTTGGLPKKGSIIINPNGTYIYTPATGQTGIDTVIYQVCDNGSPQLCTTALLIIEIIPNTNTGKEYFISEGFSPNGDPINEFWVIRAPTDSPKMSVVVYNRWGNLVYNADDYLNNWNGVANQGIRIGEGVPDGTYFYVVDFHNDKKPTIGYITITR